MIWLMKYEYVPTKGKRMDQGPAEDYDPDGVMSIQEMVARSNQGQTVPLAGMEYGDSENVHPMYNQDLDISDVQQLKDNIEKILDQSERFEGVKEGGDETPPSEDQQKVDETENNES